MYELNCELVTIYNTGFQTLDSIDAEVLNGTTQQDGLKTSVAKLEDALVALDGVIAQKQTELYEQANILRVLGDYIFDEAPGHFQCDWISKAFDTIVQQDYCTNVKGDLEE